MKVAPLSGKQVLMTVKHLRADIIAVAMTAMMLFCGAASAAVNLGQPCSPDGSTGVTDITLQSVTCVSGVWAASSSVVSAPKPTFDGAKVKQFAKAIVDDTPYFKKAITISQNVASEATILFWLMSALLVAHAGLKMIAGDNMEELIEAVITVSFFSLLFFEYQNIFAKHVPEFFTAWMNSLIGLIATGVNLPASATVGDIAGQLAANVIQVTEGVFKALENAFNINSWTDVFANIAGLVFLWFLTGPLVQQIMGVSAAYVAMFLLSDAVASIAIMIGPVFVAFGILDYTRTMFRAWVGVLVSAWGIKLIAVAALPMITAMTGYLTSNASIGFDAHTSMDTVFGILVVMAFIGEMVSLIPMTAKTLFDGVAGVGSGSASKAGGLVSGATTATQNAANKGVSDRVKSLGSSMWGSAKK